MINTNKLIPAITTISALVFSGCERDLNLDTYRNTDIEKMLVVNSILNPDSLIGVSVTRPYFFSDRHTGFTPVSDLDVLVAGKDGVWESLSYDRNSGLYITAIRPKEGERYTIKMYDNERETLACDSVPYIVDIQDIQATGEGPIHIYWDTDYRFTYKITFQDKPGNDDYYFLSIEDDKLDYEFSQMGQVDYSTDYVFQVLACIINQGIHGWKPDGVFGYPFSDKGIDGKRYTLTVSEVLQTPLVSMIKRLPRKIKLYSISKAYYEYMVSVLSMNYDESALRGNLLSWGLIEPDKIYSNINGGTGIMGCYCLDTVHIDLLQLTGGWPYKTISKKSSVTPQI